ncbi:MAG: hypothetical protein HKN45_04295 [Flavobacteriales bacterium]|nr:hypothetical protein [Flavobacteriales bacterium]
MIKGNKFTKDKVYRRLLNNAAELWEIPKTELDSLDPLAKLLLGAMAKEMERIGNELYTSDTRIFKRIAQFLLPDELQTAIPAHAVVLCHPAESGDVSRYDEMSFEKRWKNKENLNKVENATLHFSSAGDFDVADIQLKYRAQGASISQYEGLTALETAHLSSSIPSNQILLGFEISEKNFPSQVRLYFDWLSAQEKKFLYSQIQKIQVLDLSDRALRASPGLKDEERVFDLRSSVRGRSVLEEKTVSYYNDRFLRVELKNELSKEVPNFLSSALEELGDKDSSDIMWFKLILPPDLSQTDIDDVMVLPNCIPVLNRKMEKSIYKLNRELNIKKLEFENYFLEIEKAESNYGLTYDECPSLEMTEMKQGSFNLRMGGTGRLDERDGVEYLNYLLDLLRDEKQSFSALDVTSTVSDLKTIEQILQKIKKRVKDARRGSKQPFVVIKPHSTSENAHIFFWSSDGKLANNIPMNSKMRSSNAGIARDGHVTVVSTTLGGQNEMDSKEMIQKYRSTVLSRGMVVTKRDISELCRSIAGEHLDKVMIKQGILASSANKSGFQRSIDVHLVYSENLRDRHQREHLSQRIESELKSTSNFAMPIRIIIEEQHGTVEAMA